MSIQTVHQNLLLEKTGLIVHGCNAQGSMGAGFAKALAYKYPQVYRDYKRFPRGTLMLGQCIITPIHVSLVVVSGITQEFYGRTPGHVYVDYEAISIVFRKVSELALRYALPVKFPAIGAGLAGGHWPTVEQRIDAALAPCISATLFIHR